jgi:hypothetical protein
MLVMVMVMTVFSFVVAYPRMREEDGGKSVASLVILLILSVVVLVSFAAICPAFSASANLSLHGSGYSSFGFSHFGRHGHDGFEQHLRHPCHLLMCQPYQCTTRNQSSTPLLTKGQLRARPS